MISNYEYEDWDGESEDSFYSDKIDSDLEAELYGLIHHEQKIENDFCDNFKATDQEIHSDETKKAVDKYLVGNERDFFECNDESLFISKCENSSVKKAESIPEICFEDSHRIVTNNLNVSPIQSKDFKQSKKRKSDSINNDVEKNTGKKLKKESEKIKNETVNLESSDSDSSIIYLEPSTSKDMKTNLSNLQSAIILSSEDSDSSTSIFEKRFFNFQKNAEDSDSSTSIFEKSGLNFNNASMQNMKVGDCLSDPWQVNTEDLYRSKKFSNRYHSRLSENCTNCKESGHVARSCPYPPKRKCYLCGGDHFSQRCTSLFCYICQMGGHTAKQCWRAVEQFCSHCHMKGHLRNHCPDIWRRYHLTTTNSELVEAEDEVQDGPIYCYNCGYKGHFGGKCTENRMHSSSILTWPLVISYNDPSEMNSQTEEYRSSFHGNKNQRCSREHMKKPNALSAFTPRELRVDATHDPVFQGQNRGRNRRENRKNKNAKTLKDMRNNYFKSGRTPFNKKMKELRKKRDNFSTCTQNAETLEFTKVEISRILKLKSKRQHMKERERPRKGNKSVVKESYFPRSPRAVSKVLYSNYNRTQNTEMLQTQRNFTEMQQTSVEIDDVPQIVRVRQRKMTKRRLKTLRRKEQRAKVKAFCK